MSLKAKAINSFNWTAFEMLFSQGAIFIVGVILARILSPEDFGVIGIITAFLAISNSIIEGGFTSALLRKIDSDDNDYNTVFFSNLIVGILLYFLLLLFSESIAEFFELSILEVTLNYSGAVLIINAISMIQRTLLSKQLNFRFLAIISIIASFVSGLVAVLMAYNNYGIWSLVALLLLKPSTQTLLLWSFTKWRPSINFSTRSFNELFNFGYKVLVAGLINTIYKNIYYVLIGKLFSPAALGYYTRAEQFQSPISGNISRAISKISFPILSTLQDDGPKLKLGFIKFLKFSFFLTCIIMSGIAAMAKPIILLLIGSKWSTSIFYLQLMCIPGILYPLQILHLNLLLIKGHSNLNLKLEIIKKIILFPLVYFLALKSINAMLYGLILFSVIEYFINSFFTKRLINYPLKNQLLDLLPFIFMSFIIFMAMYSITFLSLDLILMLVVQFIVGAFVFLVINEILKLNEYIEIKVKAISIIKKFIS